MGKAVKCTCLAVALLAVALLGSVVFGEYRIRDRQGNVLLGWDAAQARLRWLEKPRLSLDGPHAFRDATGIRIVGTVQADTDWRLHTATLPAQPLPVLKVRVANPALTRFDVPLRPAPTPPEAAVFASNPVRLLMVSDMEGEFDKFVSLMQSQGVIGQGLHWRFGSGHVALVGDFVDRGRDMVPLLWLIYRLDGEARVAGGRVHYVLGNHEQLALAGTRKYWPRHLVATASALGTDGHERLFSRDSVLGEWLRSKPVIARVGDHLLVHGGVSRHFLDSGLDLEAANALARSCIDCDRDALPAALRPVLGRHGLTWYRGMALPHEPRHAEEEDPIGHLRQVLSRYGVRRVAIGHSLAPEVMLEQQGTLLRLDMHHAGRIPQAALYESGRLWRVSADGRRERLQAPWCGKRAGALAARWLREAQPIAATARAPQSRLRSMPMGSPATRSISSVASTVASER